MREPHEVQLYTGESQVRIAYTNWQGTLSSRLIHPIRFWYGTTKWHPEPGWMLLALDLDKQVKRDFALSGISGWKEELPSGEDMANA